MDIDFLIAQLTDMRREYGRIKVDCESPDEDPVAYYTIEQVKHYTKVSADGNEDRVSLELLPYTRLLHR